jgi:DNA-binding MarR family transcriptional regulator
MKQKILDEVKSHYDKTNCGTTLIQLRDLLKIEISDLKKLLNELHKEKLIVIRKGINNLLIYEKTTNLRQ